MKVESVTDLPNALSQVRARARVELQAPSTPNLNHNWLCHTSSSALAEQWKTEFHLLFSFCGRPFFLLWLQSSVQLRCTLISLLTPLALPCKKQLASQPYFCLWLQPPLSWVGSAVLSRALKCLGVVCTVTRAAVFYYFFNSSEIPSVMAQCCSMERQW